MRWVIQRVKRASVTSEDIVVGSIENGLLILMGVEHSDDEKDVDWLVQKALNMRIFSDELGKMNLNIGQVDGQVLLVSQFTLHALTAKGNRPSFIQAAHPETAHKLYEYAKSALITSGGKSCESGRFGYDMQIECQLDGPVTIIIDSKQRI